MSSTLCEANINKVRPVPLLTAPALGLSVVFTLARRSLIMPWTCYTYRQKHRILQDRLYKLVYLTRQTLSFVSILMETWKSSKIPYSPESKSSNSKRNMKRDYLWSVLLRKLYDDKFYSTKNEFIDLEIVLGCNTCWE